MAFTAGFSVNNQNQEIKTNKVESREEGGKLNFQDLNVRLTPYQLELMKEGLYQKIIKAGNALNLLSPIILELMYQDDKEMTDSDLTRSFKLIVSKLDECTKKVSAGIGIDPTNNDNLWAKNVIEKELIFLILSDWRKNKAIDVEKIVNLSDLLINDTGGVSDRIKDQEDLNVKIELMIVINNIYSHMISSGSAIKVHEEIGRVSEYLVNKSYKELKRLVTKEEELLSGVLFVKILKEIAEVFKRAWDVENMRFKSSIEKLVRLKTKSEVNDIVKSYVGSSNLAFERIEKDTNKYFDRITNMVHQLIQ